MSSAALAQEREGWEAFKTHRVEGLQSDTGWLTLDGLFWLKEGKNTFGSAPSNSLQLDNKSLAAQAGTFVLQDKSVHFIAAKNAGITHDGEPRTSHWRPT